jgi:hypothetical protein
VPNLQLQLEVGVGQGGPPRVAAPGITSGGGKRSVLCNGPHHHSAAVGRRDASQPTTQGRSLLLLLLELLVVLVLLVHGEGRGRGASVGVGVVGCRCRLVVHQAVEGGLLLVVVLKVAGCPHGIEMRVLLRMMRLLWMVIHLLVLLVCQFHFNAAATRGLMVVMHRMVIRRRPSDLLTATE